MKITACIVFVVLSLAQNPAKKPDGNDTQSQNKADSPREAQSPVTVNCNQSTGAVADHHESEAPKWYATIEWANWFLVLVAAGTGYAIWLQTLETGKAAEAALANSVAAKQAVDIVISKERCRISVNPDSALSLKYHRNPTEQTIYLNPADPQGVSYNIHIYGLTEGHILEGTARACMSESEDPPNLPAFPMRGLPSRVMFRADEPESGYQSGFAPMLPRMESLEDMVDVVEGRKFIHFWGSIRYRDVFFDAFQQGRETTFRRVWRFTESAASGTAVFTPLGGRFGAWHKCGSPEDNRET